MKDSKTLEEQFLEILENHKKLVFKVANAYGRSAEDRKDLSQEIILQLWKSFPKYDSSYALSTWIYRIALNVSISFYRKEKTRKKTHSAYQQELGVMQWEDPVVDERLKLLYQFIEQLKPLDKAIIILYLECKKNKEIGEIMGISETNVSTKINRIKKKLSTFFNAKNKK